MSKPSKKSLIPLFVIILLAASAGYSAHAYRTYKYEHTFVNVYPVDQLSKAVPQQADFSYGTIDTERIQKIQIKDAPAIQEILVNDGEHVTVGTPLVLLDNSHLKRELDMQSLTIENIDLSIQSVEHDIKLLEKSSDPSKDLAEPDRKKQLNEKNIERQTLLTDRKEAVLNYEQKKKQVEAGMIYADIDGEVKRYSSESDDLSAPLLTVTCENNISVHGTINELDLSKYPIGHHIRVENPDTGAVSEGEITAIESFPEPSISSGHMINPNTSFYAFTALLYEADGFADQDRVFIHMHPDESTESTNTIVIPMDYIHTEAGTSCVYAADSYGCLQKRNIVPGAIVNGSDREIIKGLNLEDQIAFPSDPQLKEGARVKTSSPVLHDSNSLSETDSDTLCIQLYKNGQIYDPTGSERDLIPAVTPETLMEMCEIKGIERAAVYYTQSDNSRIFHNSHHLKDGQLYGIDANYFDVYGTHLLKGRTFVFEDFKTFKKTAILDQTAVQVLFPDENPIGQSLEIYGEVFTVIGICDQTSHAGQVFVPDSLWPMLYTYDAPQELILKLKKLKDRQDAGAAALHLLNSRLVLSDFYYTIVN